MRGVKARAAAVQMLGGVLQDRKMLSDLTDTRSGPLAGCSGPERARAQSLTTGVLRNLERLDAVIAHFVQKAPVPTVQHILRIAAHELLVEDLAEHGVVNTAVTLAKRDRRAGRMAGMVNAVSRKIAGEGRSLWAEIPVAGLPEWLAGPIAKAYGAEVPNLIAAALTGRPPIDLTVKEDAGHWAEKLDGELLPTGSVRLHKPVQISRLPGYDKGAWWVQDAAAAMPVRLAGDVAGKRVLDLCAAPGGKTMQLAAFGADVTALDNARHRLRRVEENLRRTGLKANVVEADARKWTPDRPFDVILLDAPCSATGTLRRHPDLPHARPNPDLAPLLALQADLLDRACDWLAPGGTLVYCTCSLLPREGEAQIDALLARRQEMSRQDWVLPEGWVADWRNPEGDLRLRPDFWAERGGMDGFYAAKLTRNG